MAWANNPSKHPMPGPIKAKHLTRLINQTLRTTYRLEEIEKMDPEDVADVLELRDALITRMNLRLKRPDAQKHPEGVTMLEILNLLM